MTDILPPNRPDALRKGPVRLPGWVRVALLSAGLSLPTVSCRPAPKATPRARFAQPGVLPSEPELKTRIQREEKEEPEDGESETEEVLEGPDGSFLYGAPEVMERDVTRAPELIGSPEAENLD